MRHNKTVYEEGVLPQIDLTGEPADEIVEIEVDHKRGVLYVSAQGVTILRICRSKFTVKEVLP